MGHRYVNVFYLSPAKTKSSFDLRLYLGYNIKLQY